MSDVKESIEAALVKLAESSAELYEKQLADEPITFTVVMDDVEDSTRYTTATPPSARAIVTPKGSKIPTKAGYMVSVDGNSGPQKVHDTIEQAKAEAERLSSSNVGKLIRILYLVGVYAPTHEFRELV
jgi:hypothetical protein